MPGCPALPTLSRNLEEVCRFPELPARKPLTYQAKQLIAREIEMEKMRRAEALVGDADSPQVSPPLVWGRAGPSRAVPSEWTLPLDWPCPSALIVSTSAGRRESPQGQRPTGGCRGKRSTVTHSTQPRAAAGAHPEESCPGRPGWGPEGGQAGGAVRLRDPHGGVAPCSSAGQGFTWAQFPTGAGRWILLAPAALALTELAALRVVRGRGDTC